MVPRRVSGPLGNSDSMGSKKQVVVLDGGTGQSLYDMGFTEIEGHVLWSALPVRTNPQALVDLHSKFYESGSDVVLAATYQASVEGYAKYFQIAEAEAENLVTEGVKLATQARDKSEAKIGRKCWVAGSVGPYGAILSDRSEYTGKYADTMSAHELSTWHTKRMALILKGKPDLLAVETVPVVKEAEAILESLKSFPGVRTWFSFQCKDAAHTGHGEVFSDAVRTVLQSDSVIAVGLNCTYIDDVTPLLQSIAHLDIKVPVLVKPNRGGEQGHAFSNVSLTDKVPAWLEHGATWIGGCCCYGPQDIAELRHFLETKSDVDLPGLSQVL